MSTGSNPVPEGESDAANTDATASVTDVAMAKAQERAHQTASENISSFGASALPPDTANLRYGPDLHPGLLGLLPMVGVWEGKGEINDPDDGEFAFGQQIIISHDGGNYLSWQSKSWRLATEDSAVAALNRETGFWRIGEDDTIEFLVSHSAGFIEVYYGSPLHQTAWELTTDVVIRSGSGPEVGGAKRLYGLVEGGDLGWVEERTRGDNGLTPHMSARLARTAG